ncbi:hypothetical protein VDIAB_110073 [Vibrio diabolicus]|nr:hypothetical protein VDIAB_110073 [Vibrio diabolicus]
MSKCSQKLKCRRCFWFLIRLLIELWLFLFRMSYQSLVALLERKYEISSIAKCDMSRFIHVTICW